MTDIQSGYCVAKVHCCHADEQDFEGQPDAKRLLLAFNSPDELRDFQSHLVYTAHLSQDLSNGEPGGPLQKPTTNKRISDNR